MDILLVALIFGAGSIFLSVGGILNLFLAVPGLLMSIYYAKYSTQKVVLFKKQTFPVDKRQDIQADIKIRFLAYLAITLNMLGILLSTLTYLPTVWSLFES